MFFLHLRQGFPHQLTVVTWNTILQSPPHVRLDAWTRHNFPCTTFFNKIAFMLLKSNKENDLSLWDKLCPQCLSPRMHQTSNNRYNPNGYGSLRVKPITCELEAPKRHGIKTRLFNPPASFLFFYP